MLSYILHTEDEGALGDSTLSNLHGDVNADVDVSTAIEGVIISVDSSI
jgi:hypothetical protein